MISKAWQWLQLSVYERSMGLNGHVKVIEISLDESAMREIITKKQGLGIFFYKRTVSEGLVSKEAIVPCRWRREMWIFAIKRVVNGQIPSYKDYEDYVSSVRHLSAHRYEDELTLETNFKFVTLLHWETDPYEHVWFNEFLQKPSTFGIPCGKVAFLFLAFWRVRALLTIFNC